jgi:hypothetical protein
MPKGSEKGPLAIQGSAFNFLYLMAISDPEAQAAMVLRGFETLALELGEWSWFCFDMSHLNILMLSRRTRLGTV